MNRYKKNLHLEGNKVFSYDTHVATISGNTLEVHGYWSCTTSKHINYVAKELGLKKVDAPRDVDPDEGHATIILQRSSCSLRLLMKMGTKKRSM